MQKYIPIAWYTVYISAIIIHAMLWAVTIRRWGESDGETVV